MGYRMWPIKGSQCLSQPGNLLPTAMAPQQAVPWLWSSSACQTPLPQHKHSLMATEVTLSLLCVYCWFLRDGSWTFLEIGP